MPQSLLKRDYVVMTVSCRHCQPDHVVHVLAGTRTWSSAYQSVVCVKCGRHFEVMLLDLIIGGPFLPPGISSPR